MDIGVFNMSNSAEEWMRDMSEKMGKVIAGQEAMAEDIQEIKVQTTKTNGRVTKLEQWKTRIAGYAAGVAAVVAILWKILTEVLK